MDKMADSIIQRFNNIIYGCNYAGIEVSAVYVEVMSISNAL